MDTPAIPNITSTPSHNQTSTIKERITIRLDKDILAWFRSLSTKGHGYQTRINLALREYKQNGSKSWEDVLRRVMREEIQKIAIENSSSE